MRTAAGLLCVAPLMVAAAPYSDERIATGFAQIVELGRDISPLMSAAVPETVAANLKALEGCKIVLVESLNSTQVDYVVEWKCRKRLAKGLTNAAMLKIVDGRISQIIMSEQINR